MTKVYIAKNGQVKSVVEKEFVNCNGVSLKKRDNNAPYLTNTDKNISISHKDHYLVVAFSDGKVGIDIEKPCERIEILRVGERYFGEEENKEIKTIKDFYYAWTKKESYSKLITTGLSSSVLATDTRGMTIDYEGTTYYFYHYERLEGYIITVVSPDKEVEFIDLLNKEEC